MSLSRRNFLYTANAATAASFVRLRAQEAAVQDRCVFRHGVASGDPLSDRVILWKPARQQRLRFRRRRRPPAWSNIRLQKGLQDNT